MRVNAKIINIQDDGEYINIDWMTENKQIIESRYTDGNRTTFLKRLGDRGISSLNQIKNTLFSISTFESKGNVKVRPETIMTDAEIQTITVAPTHNKTTNKSFSNKEWAAEQGRIGSIKLHNRKTLEKIKESTLKLFERQKENKIKLSDSLKKTCTHLNSILDEEIKKYQ